MEAGLNRAEAGLNRAETALNRAETSLNRMEAGLKPAPIEAEQKSTPASHGSREFFLGFGAR